MSSGAAASELRATATGEEPKAVNRARGARLKISESARNGRVAISESESNLFPGRIMYRGKSV